MTNLILIVLGSLLMYLSVTDTLTNLTGAVKGQSTTQPFDPAKAGSDQLPIVT